MNRYFKEKTPKIGSGITLPNSSIARSLITNTDILILDEATSALDKDTPKELNKNIFSLMAEKTVFVVSHKEDVLKYADVVYYIDEGKIIDKILK
tara:strand:+ start:131 stop:415 length:285 start_codon:yes stop_codon:yes gene_type:complete